MLYIQKQKNNPSWESCFCGKKTKTMVSEKKIKIQKFTGEDRDDGIRQLLCFGSGELKKMNHTLEAAELLPEGL